MGLAAQVPALADPFAPLRFLAGSWKGDAQVEPGHGISTRTCQFEMKGRFFFVKNRSVWEIGKGKTEAEVHEDRGLFSYDRNGKVLVLRQFHLEDFVNEYHLTGSGPDFREFTTVRIENRPPGWLAREVYEIASIDEFVETFYLPEPGKEFEQYAQTRFRRAEAVRFVRK